MRPFTLPLAVLCLAAVASMAQAAGYPGVLDESVETAASRVMKLSVVIPAPRATLWRAMVEPAELKRWNVPVAFVDLRPGGDFEASYDAGAHAGDPQNIKQQILAVDPERMFVFRNVQAPAALPGRERFQRVVSTAAFEDAGQGKTRVTLWQVGYGGGEEDKAVFAFFRNGNAYLLANMNHVYGGGPKPASPEGH